MQTQPRQGLLQGVHAIMLFHFGVRGSVCFRASAVLTCLRSFTEPLATFAANLMPNFNCLSRQWVLVRTAVMARRMLTVKTPCCSVPAGVMSKDDFPFMVRAFITYKTVVYGIVLHL